VVGHKPCCCLKVEIPRTTGLAKITLDVSADPSWTRGPVESETFQACECLLWVGFLDWKRPGRTRRGPSFCAKCSEKNLDGQIMLNMMSTTIESLNIILRSVFEIYGIDMFFLFLIYTVFMVSN
jgi:hypothetical protein